MIHRVDKLLNVDSGLVGVLREVKSDFMVIWGQRGKEDQEKAFTDGKSKAHWPESPHNKEPSMAVDLAPFPIDWPDKARFILLAGMVLQEAAKQGIKVVWGGTFKSQPGDLGHFERQL